MPWPCGRNQSSGKAFFAQHAPEDPQARRRTGEHLLSVALLHAQRNASATFHAPCSVQGWCECLLAAAFVARLRIHALPRNQSYALTLSRHIGMRFLGIMSSCSCVMQARCLRQGVRVGLGRGRQRHRLQGLEGHQRLPFPGPGCAVRGHGRPAGEGCAQG